MASGRYQVGVVNYKVYDQRVANGSTDPEQVKIIWRTPFYADYNFTAHPVLETRFAAGFTDLQVLLAGGDSAFGLGNPLDCLDRLAHVLVTCRRFARQRDNQAR